MHVDLDHPAISGYLARLEAAAAGLPRWRREELVAEIRGHLSDALAGAPAGDDAAVLGAVDRLGDPADIVAAEPGHAQAPSGAPAHPGRRPAPAAAPAGGIGAGWGPVELAAVIGLAVSLLTGGVGLLVGIICTWISDRRTTREKLVATLLSSMLVLPVLVALLALVVTGSSVQQGSVSQTGVPVPEVSVSAPAVTGGTP